MTTKICDFCGSAITEGNDGGNFLMLSRLVIDISRNKPTWRSYDLCHTCGVRVTDAIDAVEQNIKIEIEVHE